MMETFIIQYKVDENGTTDDFDKRVEVEDLMEGCLDRTNLGNCDGGDLGSGTMNVFCFVVDPDKAQKVIVDNLRAHSLLDGAVIAQRIGEDYKVIWPPDFQGEFSVL
jgi:hypothetical protein